MRERVNETIIEIPLSEYRHLIEELTECKIGMHKCVEDEIGARMELKQVKEELEAIKERHEAVLVELISYKKLYDKED